MIDCRTCKYNENGCIKGYDFYPTGCQVYLAKEELKQDTIMDQAKAVLELQQHGETMQTMGIMTGGFISGLRKAGISDEIILQILPVYFRTVLKIKGE